MMDELWAFPCNNNQKEDIQQSKEENLLRLLFPVQTGTKFHTAQAGSVLHQTAPCRGNKVPSLQTWKTGFQSGKQDMAAHGQIVRCCDKPRPSPRYPLSAAHRHRTGILWKAPHMAVPNEILPHAPPPYPPLPIPSKL